MKKRIKEYLDLLHRSRTYLGDVNKGEIEIVNSPELIRRIETTMKKRIKKTPYRGYVSSWKAGIISMSPFFIFLRDPVLFPGKDDNPPIFGLHDRVIYVNEVKGVGGVCLLPITPNNEIILNLSFRHSLRCLSVEAAGTISKINESTEQSIVRCMNTEFKVDTSNIQEIRYLGFTISERGIMGAQIPVYAVFINNMNTGARDSMIKGHIPLPLSSFYEHRLKGEMYIKGIKYVFADAYTDSAIHLLSLSQH